MTRYGELLESTGRPVEAQKILGRHLQKYRKDLDLTLAPVAARLNASPAKLSRIENGESRVSDDDLHQLLTTYDVTDRRERQTLLTFNSRLARGQWWDSFPTMDSRLSSLLVLESFAPIMHTYETLCIPGLLQTRAYAAAVIGLAGGPRNRPGSGSRCGYAANRS